MHYLIYTSYALQQFTEEELNALLLQSRKKNALLDITGMLYYYNNSFIQLIEGNKKDVTMLYKDIVADTRHHLAVIIKEGDTNNRFFPDWSMGYKFLNKKDLHTGQQSEYLGVIDRVSVMKLFKITNKEES
nr:BLUF domain-containing protein [uncultured Pedobacter sp.]